MSGMKRILFGAAVAALMCVPSGAFAFSGGDGSPGDPYQISTCQHLQSVGYTVNLDKSFVLTQDIDCTGFGELDPDFSSGFSPIGSQATQFTGTFDGGGFTIDALTMANYGSFAGLFARTSGATITDVRMTDAVIALNGQPAAGLLVGSAANTDISGAYASGSLNDNAPTTYRIGVVRDGEVHGVYTEGFKVHYTTRQFPFSGLDGPLTLDIVQSGPWSFAGVDAAVLSACGTAVPLSSAVYADTGEDITPWVRAADLDVVDSHDRHIRASWSLPAECGEAVLSLTANEYGRGAPFKYPNGGAVPYAWDAVRATPATDGLISEYDAAAPLFTPYWQPSSGHPSGNVPVFVSNDDEYLYVAADLTIDNTDDVGEDWISVTIGGREFKVTDADPTYGSCAFGTTARVPYRHNTCELRIPRSELPGGSSVGLVLGYYGTAASSKWGGLVGEAVNGSTISQSSAHTTIAIDDTGTFAMVGGLVGTMEIGVTITDSFARGTIDHDDFGGFLGGLVGDAEGDITNSYAAVELIAGIAPSVGGLAVLNTGDDVSSYWDTDVSGTLVSGAGTGKTTAEMQTQSTFVGWDFDTIWGIEAGINDGYPKFGPVAAPTPTPSSGGRRTGGVMPGSKLAIELGLYTPTPTPRFVPPILDKPFVPPAPSFLFTKFLARGMVGEEVRQLQLRLKSLGFFPADTDATGFFGPITEEAVRAFQRAHGIPPLGLVGPLTRAALNR